MFGLGSEAKKYFSGQQLEVAKAIEKEDLAAIRALSKGLDLNQRNGDGRMNFLVFAVKQQKVKAIALLMQLGASPVAPVLDDNGDEYHAAYSAVAKRVSTDALKVMLDNGMDPNTLLDGGSILFDAQTWNNTPAIELLVARGADVNAPDKIGNTVLLKSLHSYKYDYSLYWLAHGADGHAMTKDGLTIAYVVQNTWSDFEKGAADHPGFLKLKEIKQKLLEQGVEFPALSPAGERKARDIVWCANPVGWRKRSECLEIGGKSRWLKDD
ncbi:ankyrin repeat domain-containing protein [Photobacterium alginatilyticum]|uniref:ankyrin repeat domain-containing protein n=1 Tax=Photobacterium alginatilyticum TaxID=1775171 RepID=UPI0040686F6A